MKENVDDKRDIWHLTSIPESLRGREKERERGDVTASDVIK